MLWFEKMLMEILPVLIKRIFSFVIVILWILLLIKIVMLLSSLKLKFPFIFKKSDSSDSGDEDSGGGGSTPPDPSDPDPFLDVNDKRKVVFFVYDSDGNPLSDFEIRFRPVNLKHLPKAQRKKYKEYKDFIMLTGYSSNIHLLPVGRWEYYLLPSDDLKNFLWHKLKNIFKKKQEFNVLHSDDPNDVQIIRVQLNVSYESGGNPEILSVDTTNNDIVFHIYDSMSKKYVYSFFNFTEEADYLVCKVLSRYPGARPEFEVNPEFEQMNVIEIHDSTGVNKIELNKLFRERSFHQLSDVLETESLRNVTVTLDSKIDLTKVNILALGVAPKDDFKKKNPNKAYWKWTRWGDDGSDHIKISGKVIDFTNPCNPITPVGEVTLELLPVKDLTTRSFEKSVLTMKISKSEFIKNNGSFEFYLSKTFISSHAGKTFVISAKTKDFIPINITFSVAIHYDAKGVCSGAMYDPFDLKSDVDNLFIPLQPDSLARIPMLRLGAGKKKTLLGTITTPKTITLTFTTPKTP